MADIVYARGASNVAASMVAAAGVIHSRADLAYAFASLVRTHAKGNLGEVFAEQAFLKDKLGEVISGRWVNLTPRVGRQGFDHLFVRMQRNGKFKWMVCESKYGSSQLGATKDGMQMSGAWIRARARRLGDAYIKLADQPITYAKQPWMKSGIRSYDVPLANGGKATFWKDKAGWHYDGPIDQLKQAQETARKMGADLQSAGCNIRGRRFHIEAQGNDIKITLDDLKSVGESPSIGGIQHKAEIVLKDVLDKKISNEDLKKAIAEELKKRFKLTDSEAQELAADIAERKTNGSLLREAMSTVGHVAVASAAAGVISGVVDVGVQYALTRKVDFRRTIFVSMGAGTGTAVGQSVSVVLIRTNAGRSMVRMISRSFRLRGGVVVRNSIAGGVGAVTTSIVTSYAGVLWGGKPLEDANRECLSGIGGTAGGTVGTFGVTSVVTLFGHAGTGTALSSLSGAAYNNALLAWFGMGGGKVVGGAVLGVVGVVIGCATSAAITYGFEKLDEVRRIEYFKLKTKVFANGHAWDDIARSRISFR